MPRNQLMPQIGLRRNGVSLSSGDVHLPGNDPPPIVGNQRKTPTKTEATTTAAPVYPGHTLILGDSLYDSPGGGAVRAIYVDTNGRLRIPDPQRLRRT